MIIMASSLVDQAAETSWPVRLFPVQMCRQGRCARLMIARCHQGSRLILHCRSVDGTTRTSSRNWRSPERSLARPLDENWIKQAVSKRFEGTKMNLAQGGRLHLLHLIVVHHGWHPVIIFFNRWKPQCCYFSQSFVSGHLLWDRKLIEGQNDPLLAAPIFFVPNEAFSSRRETSGFQPHWDNN